MKLALRLIAVGIVVLASLLYAGAVQIGTRNAEIASYSVGQNAVRLVERLDDVSAAAGRVTTPPSSPASTVIRARNIAMSLMPGRPGCPVRRARRDGHPGAADRRDLRTRLGAAATRPAEPGLVRLDERRDARIVPARRHDRRHARQRDRTLTACSPKPRSRRCRPPTRSSPGSRASSSRPIPRTAAATASRARRWRRSTPTLARPATWRSKPRWFDGLPPRSTSRKPMRRAHAVNAFLELLATHIARGDALHRRPLLLAPVADASAHIGRRSKRQLLPLLEHRLTEAAAARAHTRSR